MPFRTRVLVVVTTFVLGTVLFSASILFIVELLKTALSNPQVQVAAAGMAILLTLLWWLWLQVPNWLRKLIQRCFHWKHREKGGRS